MSVQPVGATQTDPNGGISSTDSTAALGNENTFLQLMVAQLKNQDPTQPVDSTTFMTQLAQFSSLEQLIGIHQGVQQLNTAAAVNTTSQDGTSQTPPAGQS